MHVLDASRQNRIVDWFGDKIRGPHPIGVIDRLHIVQSGHHEYRNVLPTLEFANSAAGFEAVELEHHDVQND